MNSEFRVSHVCVWLLLNRCSGLTFIMPHVSSAWCYVAWNKIMFPENGCRCESVLMWYCACIFDCRSEETSFPKTIAINNAILYALCIAYISMTCVCSQNHCHYFFSFSFVVFLLVPMFLCYHIMWWIKMNILASLDPQVSKDAPPLQPSPGLDSVSRKFADKYHVRWGGWR